MTSVLREDLGQDLAMMARLVQSQLTCGMTAFFQRDPRLAEQVTQKDDQVDNLLGLIEVKCFERIAETPPDAVRSRQLRLAIYQPPLSVASVTQVAALILQAAFSPTRTTHLCMTRWLITSTRFLTYQTPQVIRGRLTSVT